MLQTMEVLLLVCTIAGLHGISSCMTTVNATFGSQVTLNCNIGLNETVEEVIWESSTANGNVTLSPQISGISGSIPENPALTILVASIFDSGIYTCTMRTYNTTIQSNATVLMINGAIPDVQIESKLSSGIYGVPITLYVEIDATPISYHIYWTHENEYGETITINSRSTGYEGGNISVPSLTIRYPRFIDKGLYTCYARNALGLGYSYKIRMNVKGDVPKVSVDSLNYEVSFGSAVDLNCTVTASPLHFKIFWHRHRNNFITTITEHTEGVTGSTNDMPVLKIEYVTTHDAGSYTCLAENSIGVGSSRSILLSVIGDRPSVEVRSVLYSTLYGKAVTLECNINSDPPLTAVYWQKKRNGGLWSTISSGTVGIQGINITHPSLTLEFPVKSDAGEYICFAVNAIGSSGSLPTLLIVIGATPVVTVSSNHYLANYGIAHTLHCNVTSSPDHREVIWEVIQNGVVRTITSKTSGIRGVTKSNPSLTINFVTLSDDGLYTCCAKSIIGTGKSRAVRLSIDAALPYVSVALPTYTVEEGDGISLSCEVISTPRHTHVYWHKERDTVVSILKEGTTGILGVTVNQPSLTINQARKGDSGQYTCFAINAIGIGFSRVVSLEVTTSTEEFPSEIIINSDDKHAADYNIMYSVIASVGALSSVIVVVLAIWKCICRSNTPPANDNKSPSATGVNGITPNTPPANDNKSPSATGVNGITPNISLTIGYNSKSETGVNGNILYVPPADGNIVISETCVNGNTPKFSEVVRQYSNVTVSNGSKSDTGGYDMADADVYNSKSEIGKKCYIPEFGEVVKPNRNVTISNDSKLETSGYDMADADVYNSKSEIGKKCYILNTSDVNPDDGKKKPYRHDFEMEVLCYK